MITVSDAARSALGRSYTYRVSVQSWLGSTLLAEDVPIAAGGEDTDRSLSVPEMVRLTVPRRDRGISWAPTASTSPLAANGQRLRVQLGIGLPGGQPEWFQRGWFLVQDSEAQGDSVTVTAVGLLSLVDEARLISPLQPSGTLSQTLRALVEPALTVVVDAGLTDRSVPSGINYDEDRLGAVKELLDAWPADAHVDPYGFLSVLPATQSTTPVLNLTNGTGGTVVTADGQSSREGACSVVVARGTATDGGQVQGVAYDTSGGPHDYRGPFNPLLVPYFFPSPLLTSPDQCVQAATTVLARLKRNSGTAYTVTMVPDPTIQAGDVVAITTDTVTALPCSVESLRLPYTPGGGAQTLGVRSLI